MYFFILLIFLRSQTVRVIKQQNVLSRWFADFPALEIVKMLVDIVLGNLL